MGQIVTPRGEVAFPHVFTPQPPFDSTKQPQYGLTLLWDVDSENLAKLRKAIVDTATEKFGAKAAQMLKKGQLRSPLRNGDEKEDLENFQGKVYMNIKSNEKPQVVDQDIEPLMSQMDFYGGCFARADIYLFAYDKAGNKGVSALLNSVQKLDDGERKSGRRSAEQAFGETDDASDEVDDEGLI